MSHGRTADRERSMDRVVALVEAVLFASPEPVTPEELGEALADFETGALDEGLELLERRLEEADRGLRLQKIAGGYRLVTRDDLAEPLRRLFRFRNRKRLTPASLDVLSIVAYAQPITAPEIHEIRGTDPAYALRVLQERRMIRVVGRKRVVGRPMLFGTTKEFLVHFGLDSLEDLPPVEAYSTKVLPAQQRLFPVGSPEAAAGADHDLFEDGEAVDGEFVPDAGDPDDVAVPHEDTGAPAAGLALVTSPASSDPSGADPSYDA